MNPNRNVGGKTPEPVYGKPRGEVSRMLREGRLTVTVVGQGKLGLPLALVIASRGARVYGLDVNEKLVEALNKGKNPLPFEPGVEELLHTTLGRGKYTATTDYATAVGDSNVIIFTVPVTAGEQGIDMRLMKQAVAKASPHLNLGSLLITETTLPPGGTESLIPLIEKHSGLKVGRDLGLAHAPERTMSGRMIRDITESYPKVVGGLDRESLEAAVGLYQAINRRGVITVSDIRTAEAVKVFEGVYRDVNIALANELALISQELGLNAMEAIRVANTQPYSHIHTPGAGVGGHCIPVYPWFLIHGAPHQSRLLRLARKINDEMPRQVALLTVKALNTAGKAAWGARVIVHGLAYRNNVKEHHNTPTIPLVEELMSWGARVEVEDPLYTPSEIKAMGLTPFNKDYRGADALVFVTDHEQYRSKPLDEIAGIMRTPVLVDARYLFLEKPPATRFYYAAPGVGIRRPLVEQVK